MSQIKSVEAFLKEGRDLNQAVYYNVQNLASVLMDDLIQMKPFSDTEAGAMFYSLLCTAKINGVNTYDAMKYLFEQLPMANLAEDIEHLADIIMGIKSIPSIHDK